MNALVLSLALLAAAPGLPAAREHFATGNYDEVLFDLQGQATSPDDNRAAATLLGRAGKKMLEKKDPIMALQFAQTALQRNADEPIALEVGARASLENQHFDPAEQYGDRWLKVDPENPEAWLLRAEIALDEGEWGRAQDLAQTMPQKGLGREGQAKLKLIKNTAKQRLADQRGSLTEVRAIERRMEEALERIKKGEARALGRSGGGAGGRGGEDDSGGRAGGSGGTVAKAGGVTVYGTSWCQYCKKARAFLAARGVKFRDRDVEKDRSAAEELAQKAMAAKVQPRGVPVIDVNGTLVLGFDQVKIEQLLAQR